MNSEHLELATFGGGCFWCVEAVFQRLEGVRNVVSGYSGGQTPNPTYEQVCSGRTGHAEVIQIEFDPQVISYEDLLEIFFGSHDPTTLNRQGNDVGTQYRSALFTFDEAQTAAVLASRDRFGRVLRAAHFDEITTEIAPAGPFFYAEDEHQQYLAKHPDGYCGEGGTGLSCPGPRHDTSG